MLMVQTIIVLLLLVAVKKADVEQTTKTLTENLIIELETCLDQVNMGNNDGEKKPGV